MSNVTDPRSKDTAPDIAVERATDGYGPPDREARAARDAAAARMLQISSELADFGAALHRWDDVHGVDIFGEPVSESKNLIDRAADHFGTMAHNASLLARYPKMRESLKALGKLPTLRVVGSPNNISDGQTWLVNFANTEPAGKVDFVRGLAELINNSRRDWRDVWPFAPTRDEQAAIFRRLHTFMQRVAELDVAWAELVEGEGPEVAEIDSILFIEADAVVKFMQKAAAGVDRAIRGTIANGETADHAAHALSPAPVQVGTRIQPERCRDKNGRQIDLGDVVIDTGTEGAGGTVVGIAGDLVLMTRDDGSGRVACDMTSAEFCVIAAKGASVTAAESHRVTQPASFIDERSVDSDGHPLKIGDRVEDTTGHDSCGIVVGVFGDMLVYVNEFIGGDASPGEFYGANCKDTRVLKPVGDIAAAIAEARARATKRPETKPADQDESDAVTTTNRIDTLAAAGE